MPFKHYPGVMSLGFSLQQLDNVYAQGSITELEYRWRVLFWSWDAVRLTGKAGRLQDRCYDAFGLDGVDKRIARVKKLRERYIRKYYGEWLV
jgi:hypothetical protein